jgi:glycerate dehydrogenase
MKNIVVLDAHTLSPLQLGEHSPFHPNWDAIAALGPLQLYPRSKPGEVVARAQNAQILLTNKAVVSADHINALPQLEYIGVMATGYNVVDLDAARARGIPVTNIPGYGTTSVAQHVFALLLELAARVGATDAAVKNGEWVRCPDFCFTVSPFVELVGKTIGIIGYGSIGQAVARIASAFGMRVLANARSPKPSDVPVEWVSKEELFRQSDVITLHCPLTEETRHLVNRDTLAKMKSSAFLINTGRGPLIDEDALAEALRNGVIAGFGGDVLSAEPPSSANPLLSAPRTIITPHIAWASVEARTRLMGSLAKNILDFLAGTPANVVNGVTVGAAALDIAQESQESVAPPEPEPASEEHAEPPPLEAPIPQEAIAEALAAADSTTPETTPEIAAPEEMFAVPSSAPEPVPSVTIPEDAPSLVAEPAEAPQPVSQEPDFLPQEAVAEVRAAADSTTPETAPETTPETAPEIATPEAPLPSEPESVSTGTLPDAAVENAAESFGQQDFALPTPASPQVSGSESTEEKKNDEPPAGW